MYYIVPKNTFNSKSREQIEEIVKVYSDKLLLEKKLYLKVIASNDKGLLFELNYHEFEDYGNENIGDIMLEFMDILLCETNVYLAQYNAELQMFTEDIPRNYILLTEEILFENMNLEEKKLKLNDYIKKICTVDRAVLIIDPYLFPKRYNSEYEELLKYLLEELKFSKLSVITQESNFGEQLYEDIKSSLGKEIEVYFSDKYHDRFWISNSKKGFTTGSSLNGLGKRVCRINMLEDDEVSNIIGCVNSEFNNIEI